MLFEVPTSFVIFVLVAAFLAAMALAGSVMNTGVVAFAEVSPGIDASQSGPAADSTQQLQSSLFDKSLNHLFGDLILKISQSPIK